MTLPTLTWTEPQSITFPAGDIVAAMTALRAALAADPYWRAPTDTIASGYLELVPVDPANLDRVLVWWNGSALTAAQTCCNAAVTPSASTPGINYKRGAGSLNAGTLAAEPYGAGAATTGWGVLWQNASNRIDWCTSAAGIVLALYVEAGPSPRGLVLAGALVEQVDGSAGGVLLCTGTSSSTSVSWGNASSGADAIGTAQGSATGTPHGAVPHASATKNGAATRTRRISEADGQALALGTRELLCPVLLCTNTGSSSVALGVLRQIAIGKRRSGAGSVLGAGGAVLTRFLTPCNGAMTDSLVLSQS